MRKHLGANKTRKYFGKGIAKLLVLLQDFNDFAQRMQMLLMQR